MQKKFNKIVNKYKNYLKIEKNITKIKQTKKTMKYINFRQLMKKLILKNLEQQNQKMNLIKLKVNVKE